MEVSQLEALVERSAGVLSAEDHALLERLVATVVELTALIRKQGTTLARLRRLVGGLTSERTEKLLPPEKEPKKAPDGSAEPKKRPAKGHGRIPSSAYPGAERIAVKHESLAPGMRCPHCGARLYGLPPVEILRIIGQAPLAPRIWDVDHLRCSGCCAVFTAKAPAEAQGPKFSESAVAMMALLRYHNGQPLNRLDHLQDALQIPVPASTQWQVVNESAVLFQPVYAELLRLAAQSPLLHNDDTYVRILELMGKRRADLLAKGELENPERTGLFTTGIVAKTGGGELIVLFFSGRKHAGENLADLLRRRAAGLPPPIQMSDALDRNHPKGHPVIEGNCLCHGRRNLVDQVANFPEECGFLIEALREVFRIDARCVAEKLSPDERLRLHQTESGPVMEKIKAKANELLDQKKVEPNSDMGKALQYLLNHWVALTLFLRTPGAPLENNVVERALKMAIRHRNNSLFYKSERGAAVGDLFMTLIETTILAKENPFEYLTALQRFASKVAQRPADWLPWTFRATMTRLEGGQRPETSEGGGAASVAAGATSQAHDAKPKETEAAVLSAKDTWEAALRAFSAATDDLEPGSARRRPGPRRTPASRSPSA